MRYGAAVLCACDVIQPKSSMGVPRTTQHCSDPKNATPAHHDKLHKAEHFRLCACCCACCCVCCCACRCCRVAAPAAVPAAAAAGACACCCCCTCYCASCCACGCACRSVAGASAAFLLPAVPSMGEPFKLHLKCISIFHQVPEQLPAWAQNTRHSERPWAAAQYMP